LIKFQFLVLDGLGKCQVVNITSTDADIVTAKKVACAITPNKPAVVLTDFASPIHDTN